MSWPTIANTRIAPPPEWALWERHLIATMNEAALAYQERYTRRDGSFIWRESWPGFDGSDDGYESYHNWPLFFALGGSAELYERSRWLWEAVTRQFTAYGQIYREFDAHYDWMHHGESSIYLYYFGLADPQRQPDRARALRFARMYTGDDAQAPNWDAAHKMIRSPINGSRGPRFENQWDDWSTHRAILAPYPAPFEDIPGLSGPKADWTDDRVYGEILRLLNERQMRCDVPLNLTSTSLITHAYLLSGDDRLRRWVLDYVDAWAQRIAANGGLCPDNVGPNGIIGETMGGKWWGGYYGWRWPHGFMSIIQPLTIAAMNATLLTGDAGYLDMPRSQLDRMIALGHEQDGRLLIPHRHLDAGWSDYRTLRPEYPLQLWALTHDLGDLERLERFPERDKEWNDVAPGRGKGDDLHIAPWVRYIQGQNPGYPLAILQCQYAEVARRLDAMTHDDTDPETWDVHHWQQLNPVHTEALLQLTCGGPQIVYHGGLLHVRLRYYDAEQRRPGLPPDVAALVDRIEGNRLRVQLVNTSPQHARRLVLQSGAFGEHRFTWARADRNGAAVPVEGPLLGVELAPAGALTLELELAQFCRQPSYAQPAW